MSWLRLRGLNLNYGQTAAVQDLHLEVPEGQLLSLLGPSGCGKTTTMRAIAGLLPPASGRIELAGRDITDVPAHRRDIGLVFQSYALFPHLSVFDNVAFGLRMRRVAADELRERVKAALAAVGLADYAARLPAQLSGGQQQRVAVARAIVVRPRLLLLDEPLSNLDARLRLEMRAELRRLQRELGVTMLYVTHDQEEALALSDRVVILREGRIEQDGRPEQVYQRPATRFVAGFMGWENLFEVRDGALIGRDGQGRWPIVAPSGARDMAWRPEHVELRAEGGLRGEVLARSFLGERIEMLVRTPLGPIKASAALSAQWQEGDQVAVLLDPARSAVISPGA